MAMTYYWNLRINGNKKVVIDKGKTKEKFEVVKNNSNYIFNVVDRNRTSTAIISKPETPKLGKYNPNYSSIDK